MSKNITSIKSKYNTQVKTEHYDFDLYVGEGRWVSYYNQISQILKIAGYLKKPQMTVLEIGPGDGIVTDILKKLGIKVTTMDIDSSLKPDIVSALPSFNFSKRLEFDCILCCEVLEHIEYLDAEKSLNEMAKIARYAIISIPDSGFRFSIIVKLMSLKLFKFTIFIPVGFRKFKFNGEHYWELGYSGYTLNRFKISLKAAQFELLGEFRIPENPWHHFFVLKSRRFKK